MFEVFLYAFQAVMPIILLIFFGYFLRRKGFYDEKFLTTGNNLVFRVILPLLVFTNIYEVSGLSAIKWDVVLYGLCVILLLFALGLITVLFVKRRGSRGVIWQCVFRSNFAIIGIPLAQALGGAEGQQTTAVMIAFAVPLFNVLAVIALSVFGADDAPRRSVGQVVLSIVKNPLILAAAAGLACLGIRALLPVNAAGEPVFSIQRDLEFLYSAIKKAANATTFVSLMVLGGLLDFSSLKGSFKYITLATVWRTVLAPVIGLVGAVLLTRAGVLACGPGEYACYIALFGAPVAVSSAIMAAEMGGDGELARQLVVWTSVSPIVTIFTIVVIFRSAGLL